MIKIHRLLRFSQIEETRRSTLSVKICEICGYLFSTLFRVFRVFRGHYLVVECEVLELEIRMNNRIARWISLCVLAAAALTAVAADKAAPKSAEKNRVIKVESAYLRLIDHVDVPAQAG